MEPPKVEIEKTPKPLSLIAKPLKAVAPKLNFYIGDQPAHLANIFRGSSAFLICGGPSFNLVDKTKLARTGILVCGINNSVKSYRPHIWVHGDEVDHFVRSVYLDPTIMKFSPTIFRNNRIFNSDEWTYTDCILRDCPPNQYFYERGTGFDASNWLTSNRVIWGNEPSSGSGRSTMFAAIRILYELGIRTIYLLGVDFEMAEKSYHFDQTKDAGAARTNNSMYTILAQRFEQLKPKLDAAGLKVMNCNPQSKLKVFPFMSFDEAIGADGRVWCRRCQ